MECQTCKSANEAGSRFCKECGSKLAAAAPTQAAETAPATTAPPLSPEIAEKRRLRAAELLPRAFAFAEKGAIAEAIATAEEAAGLVPSSTAAHALLANLYEKSGQLPRAIEAMKKVVAQTPDATEEKARLEALQREAARRAATPAAPDEAAPTSPVAYWVPRIGAALAGALVVGIGLSLLMRPTEAQSGSKKNNGGTPALILGERSPGTAFASMPQAAPAARPHAFLPAPVNTEIDPFVSKGFATTPAPRRAESGGGGVRRQLPRRASLPDPERPSTDNVPPLVPPAPVNITAQPTQSAPPAERISVGPPPSSNGSGKPEKPADEGFIRIESHPANSGGSGNGTDKPEKAPEKLEGGDPIQQARVLQGAGRYRDAVGRYQVALAASEAPGELHQNLGLCYQRLGELGAARDAYSRAIDAYQAQLRRGREAESARRGIASCQAALEVLRG